MNKYVIELIGTFFLVLTIGLSSNPIAIGFVLAAMVYMGAHISGANYNPAVSLGIFMRKKLSAKDLIIYWIFQIIGAILAALVCKELMGKTFAPAPADGTSFINALLVEFLFTFALVSVVLNVATTRKRDGNSYFGLAIGVTVMAGAFSVGSISGGAFNPAVAIGPILVDTINGGSSMKNILIYLIGPFLGGAVASIVFKFTNPEEYQEQSLTFHE
ncbi:MAG: aquaporin [Ignavibacteria bacterium]